LKTPTPGVAKYPQTKQASRPKLKKEFSVSRISHIAKNYLVLEFRSSRLY